MKVLLGIYQDKEAIDDRLNAQGIDGWDACQVGPFASQTEALEWMDYMAERLQPHAVERLVVSHPPPSIWYGMTLAME
ncbi:MAG: hypothetical protein LBD10_08215 [Desulfobulbus sp.]|uniref:hypothetical protein n=1 Tax=Desulfobulbus sp. TaxID=895 RepID=UPI0028438FDE|nr:hypothetical protein [Desulfobulbus sp.]MDR2550165.1 hypothetical protein [Desulfobulbus sp.]